MVITFNSSKLEKTLNSEKEIRKAYGKKDGDTIKRRLDFLRAADTLADVPHIRPWRRHALDGPRKGEFAVDINENDRIVFKPMNHPLPVKTDGGLDLGSITKIMIVFVGDYH